jgi:Ca-activated chloride channel homolog
MSESIWNDPRITAYAFGEMPDDEKLEFEKEIAANPELAAAVAEATRLTDQLRSHFSSETTPPLDTDRRNEIFAGSHQHGLARNTPGAWWNAHGLRLALAASVVFLVVGIPASAFLLQNANRPLRVTSGRMADEYGLESAGQQTPHAFEGKALEREAFEGIASRYETSVPSDAEIAKRDQVSNIASEYSYADESVAVKTESPDLGVVGLPSEYPASEASPSTPFPRRINSTTVSDQAMGRSDTDEPMGLMGSMGLMNEKKQLGDVSRDRFVPPPGSFLPAPGLEIYGGAMDEGRGPGIAGDRFDPITDNPFKRVNEHPLSTFSVDVDTASYSKVRDFLVRADQLPRPDAVRIEEMINYFDYEYAPPSADSEHPFAARAEIVACPWNDSHRLARIAIKAKTIVTDERPPCNLVFLIDTSGSMDAPNKLPLVQAGLKMLLSKLGEKDRVGIVVYAGSAGLVLDSTPASDGATIRRALTQLAAGGSTNGGAGIALAYQTARDHFIKDGINRVILCSDGDFNVGTTGTDSLVRMVQEEAKGGVFLTVLGFGMGNHNDAMLEQISGKGNGNYAFIDNEKEAKKVLVEQTDSTLVTIAKDVKIQVEFNPAAVSAYRLIGYENRVLAKEDFNDDKKDAGEIGAGHAVTALYEIVPAGKEADAIPPPVDNLKYQQPLKPTEASTSDETLSVKLRYKAPDGNTSTLVEFPVVDSGKAFDEADIDVRFAAAVAGFGMKLRRSEYAGSWTYADVEKVAQSALGSDRYGLRAEFIELVRKAAELGGQER